MSRTSTRPADSGRPPPEAELVLVGTRRRRAAAVARVAELAAAVDADALTAVLRLLLLAGSRLVELAPDAGGRPFRERLEATRCARRSARWPSRP
jgi:hypothetical protein